MNYYYRGGVLPPYKNILIYNIDLISCILFIVGNPKLGSSDIFGSLKRYHNLLKERDIDTKYIYLKDEGHLIEKPKNIKMVLNIMSKWIDKYI